MVPSHCDDHGPEADLQPAALTVWPEAARRHDSAQYITFKSILLNNNPMHVISFSLISFEALYSYAVIAGPAGHHLHCSFSHTRRRSKQARLIRVSTFTIITYNHWCMRRRCPGLEPRIETASICYVPFQTVLHCVSPYHRPPDSS